jgi:hypothetical protein
MDGDYPSSIYTNVLQRNYTNDHLSSPQPSAVKVKFISRSLQQGPTDSDYSNYNYDDNMAISRARSKDSTRAQSNSSSHFNSNSRAGSSDPRKSGRPQRGGGAEINYRDHDPLALSSDAGNPFEEEYPEPSNNLAEGDSMDVEGDADAYGHEDAEGDEDGEFDGEERDHDMEDDDDAVVSIRPKRTTRRVVESDDEDEAEEVVAAKRVATVTTRGRSTVRPVHYNDGPSDEDSKPSNGRKGLQRGGRTEEDFVDEGDEDDLEEEDDSKGYGSRKRSSRATELTQKRKRQAAASGRTTRNGGQSARAKKDSSRRSTSYGMSTIGSSTEDDDLNLNDDDEEDDLGAGKEYKLRKRGEKVNYFLPAVNAFDIPQLERNNKKAKGRIPKNFGSFLPANMSGAQYAELYPDKNRDADSVSSSRPA